MTSATRSILLALVVTAGYSSAARSADEWALCGTGAPVPPRPSVEADEGDPEAVHLSAREADTSEDGVPRLRGDVRVVHGTRQLQSDELVYTESDEIMDARGNVRFWDEGVFIMGDGARLDRARNTLTMKSVSRYVLENEHGHGSAAEITSQGDEHVTAHDPTYTTCDPDSADWRILADRVEFDRVEDTATAHDTWLEFMGHRVFYLPWISFPTSDRRKSGFISPTFGVDDSTGVDVTTPYYFNLAPNYDATLSARTMSERGVQAQGEFRFLSRSFGAGRTAAEYLPFDAEHDDHRAAFNLEHRHRWTKRWSTDTHFEWISDAEYFEDLGAGLSQTSRTHLPRRFDASYRGDGWSALVRFEDFLTVDRTILKEDRPYASLPRIGVRTDHPERDRMLNFGATTELTYFERESSTTGVRAHLQPSLTYPLRSRGAFLVPKAALHLTGYDLDRSGAGAMASEDGSPSRLLSSFSLDGGAFLERPFSLRDRTLTHTIEPRLFYLLVPFERQDDIPNFDSSLSSYSFAHLFRENRFNGMDRIGDANQVTFALTSRVLDEGGEELVSAGVGQIHYFRDRRVTLEPGHEPETAGTSDIVAEFEVRPAREWRLRGALQYDTGADRTEKNALSLQYQPDRRRVVNAAYRLVRDADPVKDIEQADLSFAWPLGVSWRGVGRWRYAFSEERDRTLEAFGGVEYESCCWGFRVVGRRFLSRGDGGNDGRYSDGIFVQFELKGLTGGGASTDAFLARSIPGYENEF